MEPAVDQENQIPHRQNEPQEIERHAARRHLYKRASLCVAAQMILLVAAPLVWSVLIVLFPLLQVWAALFGITLSLLDALFIDQFQKALKGRAAKIQELFDCGVLEISWNKLKAGRQPEVDLVIECSKKYRSHVPSDQEFRDWYPSVVGGLPLHLARLVCQRTNCVWSSKLRRQFATWILVAVALTGPTVFGIGLVGGMTLEKFVLAVLAPVLPAALWGIRTARSHFESAEATDRLAAHAEDLWEKAVKGDLSKTQCEREARALQDEIFERRKSDPIIFDWVYRVFRPSYEEQAKRSAESLVAEAKVQF
jgi:SMODS-associating 4TM effector domain